MIIVLHIFSTLKYLKYITIYTKNENKKGGKENGHIVGLCCCYCLCHCNPLFLFPLLPPPFTLLLLLLLQSVVCLFMLIPATWSCSFGLHLCLLVLVCAHFCFDGSVCEFPSLSCIKYIVSRCMCSPVFICAGPCYLLVHACLHSSCCSFVPAWFCMYVCPQCMCSPAFIHANPLPACLHLFAPLYPHVHAHLCLSCGSFVLAWLY